MNVPLPRFLQDHQHRRGHIDALTTSVVTQGANLKDRTFVCDPADTLTLRGIPAIGRGVAGVIRGTQPETRACQT